MATAKHPGELVGQRYRPDPVMRTMKAAGGACHRAASHRSATMTTSAKMALMNGSNATFSRANGSISAAVGALPDGLAPAIHSVRAAVISRTSA